MISERSSLRIDIGGGVTDVPQISDEIGTCVVNFGIDVFSDKDFRQQRLLKVGFSQTPSQRATHLIYNGELRDLIVNGGDDISLISSTINLFNTRTPLINPYRINVEDDLPKGTGLGGSAGLSICLNLGLSQIIEREAGKKFVLNPDVIIKDSHKVEVEDLGIVGGFQDFIGSFFGNVNLINFQSLREVDLSTREGLGVKMEEKMKDYLDEHMVVLLFKDGNISSSVVVSDEISRFRANPEKYSPILRSIKEDNLEIYKLLTQEGDIEKRLNTLGELINHSWSLQKMLSPLVGRGLLSELEDLVGKYTFGLRGPGAGANSLFLVTKPEARDNLLRDLEPFSQDIEILFVKLNDRGIRNGR